MINDGNGNFINSISAHNGNALCSKVNIKCMQESHIGGGVYIVYPPHTIPTGPGGDIVCTEQQETLINDVSAQLNRRQNKNLETPGGPRCHQGIVHLPD